MKRLLLLLLLAACVPNSPTFGGGGQPDSGDGGGGGDGSGTTSTTDTGPKDTGQTTLPPLEGTGYEVGDTAYELTGTDQSDVAFSLWDLRGQVIVLMAGAMDVPTAVSTMEAMAQTSGAARVAYLVRDEYSTTPDSTDLMRWASEYGLYAALADTVGTGVSVWSDSNPPKTYVIDGEMVIQWVAFGAVDAGDLAAAVGEAGG